MALKVIKAGDEFAVTIPDEVIESLQLQEGSLVTLALTADRRHALLAVGDTSSGKLDPVFAKQVADFIEQYRPALEALAK